MGRHGGLHRGSHSHPIPGEASPKAGGQAWWVSCPQKFHSGKKKRNFTVGEMAALREVQRVPPHPEEPEFEQMLNTYLSSTSPHVLTCPSPSLPPPVFWGLHLQPVGHVSRGQEIGDHWAWHSRTTQSGPLQSLVPSRESGVRVSLRSKTYRGPEREIEEQGRCLP